MGLGERERVMRCVDCEYSGARLRSLRLWWCMPSPMLTASALVVALRADSSFCSVSRRTAGLPTPPSTVTHCAMSLEYASTLKVLTVAFDKHCAFVKAT